MLGSPEGGSFSNPETRGEILSGSSDEVSVRVDQEWCVGHGMCERVAPDVVSLDPDENIAYVTIGGAKSDSGFVPEELRDQADAAVNVCPQDAIEIIE